MNDTRLSSKLYPNLSRDAPENKVNIEFCSQDTQVRLLPVVEMLPSDYDLTDRPFPFDASPSEYLSYWTACLADAGIEGLKPFHPWYVPIEQLSTASTLEKFLRVHRFDDEPDNSGELFDRFSDPEEYLSAFSGGYVLSINDRLVCTPRCCGDLADILNWQMAAEYRAAEETTVWIGHPSLSVHYDGTALIFLDHHEGGGQTEWAGELVIAPDALQQAIDRAKQELHAFSQRLLPIVENLVPASQAVQITAILSAKNP